MGKKKKEKKAKIKAKKNKERKAKVKKFVDDVLGNNEALIGNEWTPKLGRKLEAYSIISKHPLGGDKYDENLMQITEWDNGEGYDIAYYAKGVDKQYSMHLNEIELLLKGLDLFGYFLYNLDELRK